MELHPIETVRNSDPTFINPAAHERKLDEIAASGKQPDGANG